MSKETSQLSIGKLFGDPSTSAEVSENNEVDTANSVSIKMPEFSESYASSWFEIIEAQFEVKGIKVSSTKFYHALSVMTPDLVSKLSREVMMSKSYELLKSAVIALYEQTKPELFAKLIKQSKMTQKPSFYLQELQKTAAKIGVSDDLVRVRFIQDMPKDISAAVATQKNLSLFDLGNLADELMPLVNANSHTAYSANNNAPSTSKKQFRSNDNAPWVPASVKPFARDQKPKICRGHIYYGKRSKTCKNFCQWPNKSNVRILNSKSPTATPAQSDEEN